MHPAPSKSPSGTDYEIKQAQTLQDLHTNFNRNLNL